VSSAREFLGEWPAPSATYLRALELWHDYYYQSELFDRSVCSGTSPDGVAVPLTTWERSQCTRVAVDLYRLLCDMARDEGIPDDELTRAKAYACDNPDDRLRGLTADRLERTRR
jgi:hypothetical protein